MASSKQPAPIAAAMQGFEQLDQELLRQQASWPNRLYMSINAGNGNIAHEFSIACRFRLVFTRCHFSAGAGTNAFVIKVKSRLSADWDTQITSIAARGTGADVWYTVPGTDLQEPSPYTFDYGDSIRCEWTNPAAGVMKWAIEMGLAKTT